MKDMSELTDVSAVEQPSFSRPASAPNRLLAYLVVALLLVLAFIMGMTVAGGKAGSGTTPAPSIVSGSGLSSDTPYDLRFIDQMITHHQMAIVSVQHMITDSTHPELRDLGHRIVTAQQQQIDQMRDWRKAWYPNAPPASNGSDMGMMGSGMNEGGMMNGAMMRGDQADRMWLQMMIPHHQQAIDMAEDALLNAQHEELKQLARDIISGQTAEISEMRGYLKAWYGDAALPSSTITPSAMMQQP